MVGFVWVVLVLLFYGLGWGSGSRIEECKFWFSDVVVSEFFFFDCYVDVI